MKHFVIIGLRGFGAYLLENLSQLGYEVIVLDQDEKLVEKAKDFAVESYVMFDYTRDNLEKIIPKTVDSVIINLSQEFSEQAILVAHYVKSLGIQNIVAKADTEIYAEIFKQIGVSRVVLPDKDAVQKITPLLTSPLISAYNLLGYQMVAAEFIIPGEYVGKSIMSLNLRQKKNINIIAVKYNGKEDFDFSFDVGYFLKEGDQFFIYGKEENMATFAEEISKLAPTEEKDGVWANSIFKVFQRPHKKG